MALQRRKSDAVRTSQLRLCDASPLLAAPLLPNAGNLTPVPAKRQFFDQVSGRFTRRCELCTHQTVIADAGDVSQKG